MRARGNLSLGPCFSGCPEPNGPQKICEILAGQIEASKVICPAVRVEMHFVLRHMPSPDGESMRIVKRTLTSLLLILKHAFHMNAGRRETENILLSY